MDWIVENVVERLDTAGIAENTLILFTGDNGPWMIEGLSGGSKGLLDGRYSQYWNTGASTSRPPAGRTRSSSHSGGKRAECMEARSTGVIASSSRAATCGQSRSVMLTRRAKEMIDPSCLTACHLFGRAARCLNVTGAPFAGKGSTWEGGMHEAAFAYWKVSHRSQLQSLCINPTAAVS